MLLLERQADRFDGVAEVGARRLYRRDRDGGLGVEQVLDDDHGVVALFHRLAVEVLRQEGQRLVVVPHGDGHVLL